MKYLYFFIRRPNGGAAAVQEGFHLDDENFLKDINILELRKFDDGETVVLQRWKLQAIDE